MILSTVYEDWAAILRMLSLLSSMRCEKRNYVCLFLFIYLSCIQISGRMPKALATMSIPPTTSTWTYLQACSSPDTSNQHSNLKTLLTLHITFQWNHIIEIKGVIYLSLINYIFIEGEKNARLGNDTWVSEANEAKAHKFVNIVFFLQSFTDSDWHCVKRFSVYPAIILVIKISYSEMH